MHLVLGSLVPIYLLLRYPNSVKWAGFAGSLTALFFMAVRLNIVIPGQVASLLPGLEGAIRHQRLQAYYVPSLHEWLVLAFIVAVGIFCFIMAKKRFNLFNWETR
jgi:molybdopterin-containing oxidoreductase family membrane subunit